MQGFSNPRSNSAISPFQFYCSTQIFFPLLTSSTTQICIADCSAFVPSFIYQVVWLSPSNQFLKLLVIEQLSVLRHLFPNEPPRFKSFIHSYIILLILREHLPEGSNNPLITSTRRRPSLCIVPMILLYESSVSLNPKSNNREIESSLDSQIDFIYRILKIPIEGALK